MRGHNHFWAIAAVAYLVTIVGLSVVKSAGLATTTLRQLENWVGGDVFLHALIATLMAFLMQMAAPSPWVNRGIIAVLNPVMGVLFLGCLLDEWIQQYIPARSFSWLDLMASSAGLVIGSILARLLRPGNRHRT